MQDQPVTDQTSYSNRWKPINRDWEKGKGYPHGLHIRENSALFVY
ncbi:hypothetical protein J2W97_002691 [Paenibacillus jamilae]|nr:MULTISPECIES: hypothetical protein [Paenibacillus]MDP9676696.1 hypothetical protein [Paenibacillus jamilae]UZS76140.1 hypothetical protein MF620_05845 [Paenibacillus polymyxa]